MDDLIYTQAIDEIANGEEQNEVWVIQDSVVGMIGYVTSEKLADEQIARITKENRRIPFSAPRMTSKLFKKRLSKLTE